MGAATRYTLSELRRDRRAVAGLAVWSLVETAPALISGYATARAIDDGFLAGDARTGLAWLGGYAIAAGIGAAGARGAYRRLGDVVEPFRDRLVRRVVTDALRGAARPDRAAVARMTRQVEVVRDTFAGLLTTVRGFVFSMVAAIAGLVALAPVLAALVAVPLLLGLGLFALLLPRLAARQLAAARTDEDLATTAEPMLRAHRDVTAAGAGAWAAGVVSDAAEAQARAERALGTAGALRGACLAVGGWGPLVVLLVAGPWLIERGIGAGALLGAMVYVRQGLVPALHLLMHGLAGGGLRYGITLRRILLRPAPGSHPAGAPDSHPTAPSDPHPDGRSDPYPAGAPESASGSHPDGGPKSGLPHPAPRGGRPSLLRMRGVTFRYGPAAAPVLDRFDLDVDAGEHLVIVGASGIGKSTLAGLMAGLIVPQHGEVRCAARVLLPQEAYVFTGTVLDNLRYLAPDAPVLRGIAALGAWPLIDRLGGLDGMIDPATLSAGEKQLIALVRAWLSPAPLAILDEATCHLDPATEARAETAFAARPGALVVIAHRLGSAARGRHVLLFDGATPLLSTHAELLRTSRPYREMSDPALLLGQVDRLDPVARAGLRDDPGQVVAHRPR
ncbi:ATP-binding cassette subfamily C protein [Catenuloplanes nepalensis]|uniref:ATP-binding cassette subfamily C protein n=1 Tax=Catenuloplanes nepalensis TaxID=587533 RepID=A0ABT9MM64_9ACTN|nr:ATP-binding cassette domain-containing protein [Catenuloplanes nepalensis]MDP9792406.1 ATP-binding cassette subfamily C protein [Catenuloplanes nepalensis]